MPTAVRSHAKINLGLYIGAPRPDGFHGLVTLYQTLEIYDVVAVSARPASSTTISITSNDIRVPTDDRNTAWKMVALALESLNTTAEVQIHIDKRLPIQGGLGAGSANAVASLIGLESELYKLDTLGAPGPGSPQTGLRLWGGGPSHLGTGEGRPAAWESQRLTLAAQVGSDVPLFLIGGAVLGLDRGQKVLPLNDIEPTWCLLAIPSIGVSTPQAFRDWDALCAAEGLTPDASQAKLNELSRAYASAFAKVISQGQQGTGSSGVLAKAENLAGPQESALVRTGISSWIQNDFERVVFPQHPSLAEIKRILAGSGTPEAAFHASLSGSGSALFGLYQARRDAEEAKSLIMSSLPESEVRTILTRTMPRQAYWREMLLH